MMSIGFFDSVISLIASLSAALGPHRLLCLISTIFNNRPRLGFGSDFHKSTKGNDTNKSSKRINRSDIDAKRPLFPSGSFKLDRLSSVDGSTPVPCSTDGNFNLMPLRNDNGNVVGWNFRDNQAESRPWEDEMLQEQLSQPVNTNNSLSMSITGQAPVSAGQMNSIPTNPVTENTAYQTNIPTGIDLSMELNQYPTYPGPGTSYNQQQKYVIRSSHHAPIPLMPNSPKQVYPYPMPMGNGPGHYVRSDSTASSSILESPGMDRSPPLAPPQIQQPFTPQQQDLYTVFDSFSVPMDKDANSFGVLISPRGDNLHSNNKNWYTNEVVASTTSDGSSDDFEIPVSSVSGHDRNNFYMKLPPAGINYASLDSSVNEGYTFAAPNMSTASTGSYQSPDSIESMTVAAASANINSSTRGRRAKRSSPPKAVEEFVCPECDASFRIKGYLTRHMKKHAQTKAYTCPFYDPLAEHPCHPSGGFSRRDTYKTHLKARHFIYPAGTRSQNRGRVAGKCQGCGEDYSCNETWVEKHIQPGVCPGIVSNRRKAAAAGGHHHHSHHHQHAHTQNGEFEIKHDQQLRGGNSTELSPIGQPEMFQTGNHALGGNFTTVLSV